ncbi:hypothetical protein EPN87_02530 [archaeon]|nr:MAG: hypothetical protein EPN87_02530 [archaeon]
MDYMRDLVSRFISRGAIEKTQMTDTILRGDLRVGNFAIPIGYLDHGDIEITHVKPEYFEPTADNLPSRLYVCISSYKGKEYTVMLYGRRLPVLRITSANDRIEAIANNRGHPYNLPDVVDDKIMPRDISNLFNLTCVQPAVPPKSYVQLEQPITFHVNHGRIQPSEEVLMVCQ